MYELVRLCPGCRGAFRSEIEVCPDCDVPLGTTERFGGAAPERAPEEP